MGKKQNILGNKTEVEIAEFLRGKGYWALIVQKGPNGQPFDIIAGREDVTWYIDAKHLEGDKVSFSFDRIEPNQRTSMGYARNFALIKRLGFVIKWERDNSRLFYLSYDKLIELEKKGFKSVKINDLEDYGEML